MFLYKYDKSIFETSKQMSKSGFFLSQLHIGRDLEFKSKIRRILTRLGWLDSLFLLIVLHRNPINLQNICGKICGNCFFSGAGNISLSSPYLS